MPVVDSIGVERIRLFVDPDKTILDSPMGRRQASGLIGGHMNIGPHQEVPLRLTPEKITGDKPELLDVADLLAFISQRYRHEQKVFEERSRQFRILYHAAQFEKLLAVYDVPS